MMAFLLSRAADRFVRLNLVEPQKDQLLLEAGLACVNRVKRIRRSPEVPGSPLKRLGLINQALGQAPPVSMNGAMFHVKHRPWRVV